MKKLWSIFALTLSAMLFVGCSSDLADDDHYKVPDWLKGNAYEVMQKEGNYSIFLRGIDLTGNTGIVSGKSIMTVVAPNDDAFKSFLNEKGYESIDAMYQAKPQYVKDLIGLHLMYYAFDWDKMVNFRPKDGDAATSSAKEVNAGYYYKHRTHSQQEIEKEVLDANGNVAVDASGNPKAVYHYERYLPIFSTKMFETKQIDAAANYNYFFPDTKWYGSASEGDGFNVANAKVNDTENVITDNGYLYHIDHVVEPLNTIYEELKNDAEFSQFFNLYNSYVNYDNQCTDEVNSALGYIAYLRSHGSLPPIAYEWPIDLTKTTISQLDKLEHDGYNVFAPTNSALDNFFKTFWSAEQGYPTIESLDPLIKEYFIKQMFSADNFIAFPEEISKGNIKTTFGTTVNFDPNTIPQKYRKICANGTLYGMDQMTAPAIFSSVVAPAFKDKNYNCFLYALDGSKIVSSLAADNTKYIALIPSNSQFENSDPQMRLYNTDKGNELQEFSTDAGAYVATSDNTKKNITTIHISDEATELKTSGTQVVNTMVPFNYWFVKDGKITCNADFNEILNPTYTGDPFVAFKEMKNGTESWFNGKSYSYDATGIFKAQTGGGLQEALAVCNDKNYPYYYFAQLITLAGLKQGTHLTFPTDDLEGDGRRLIAFIPSNDVLKANITSLPGCSTLSVNESGDIVVTKTGAAAKPLTGENKANLQAYISRYFISTEDNAGIVNYPYIGSSTKGSFITKELTSNIEIIDDGAKLSVRLVGGENTVAVSSKYSYFPFAFGDGCIQFIDGLLK